MVENHNKEWLIHEVRSLIKEIVDVSLTLFKIMIPALIIVKVLDELGITQYLSILITPLMHFVGLPEAMGIVWATTMLTNIYTGMALFFSLAANEPISVAQVTVLGSMMLIAHGLPVEGAIARKAGVSISIVLLFRIGGAFLYGYILHRLYSEFNVHQEPLSLHWMPESLPDTSIIGWIISQVESLVAIQLLIVVLLTLLRVLKRLGVERLMIKVLGPLLRTLGVSEKASTLAVVGITLGLSFGGGILINESKQGHICKRDVFIVMVMLCLLHSIIEDTLLILLLGADLNAVLWGRIIFSLVIITLLAKITNRISDTLFYRFFFVR